MNIAIFSDVHANLPALEAVLDDIDRQRPDAVFCLGDLVGYAPWPNEVVNLIRARHSPFIAGNYDLGVGQRRDDCGCAYRTELDKARGAESIAFTNQVVTDEVRAYLKSLPRHLCLTFEVVGATAELLLVHGSPRRVNEYLFADRPDKRLLRMMTAVRADIMLFGHTHKLYHKVLVEPRDEHVTYRHPSMSAQSVSPKTAIHKAATSSYTGLIAPTQVIRRASRSTLSASRTMSSATRKLLRRAPSPMPLRRCCARLSSTLRHK
ncbi:MAG: metallophosphoesterase [Ardenticatenaceae bacterium]|nr:metallophosphoesterase [Ardenticatenaceae bacterium]